MAEPARKVENQPTGQPRIQNPQIIRGPQTVPEPANDNIPQLIAANENRDTTTTTRATSQFLPPVPPSISPLRSMVRGARVISRQSKLYSQNRRGTSAAEEVGLAPTPRQSRLRRQSQLKNQIKQTVVQKTKKRRLRILFRMLGFAIIPLIALTILQIIFGILAATAWGFEKGLEDNFFLNLLGGLIPAEYVWAAFHLLAWLCGGVVLTVLLVATRIYTLSFYLSWLVCFGLCMSPFINIFPWAWAWLGYVLVAGSQR